MNIDITAIERYFRLFALPVFLMLIGFMGMMLFSGPAPASGLASVLLTRQSNSTSQTFTKNH